MFNPNYLPGLPGSSPLTRGKQLIIKVLLRARGLIPAHAGKTLHAGADPRALAAHPRSRGENHPAPRGPRTPLWLIPAHAGKTRLVVWENVLGAGSSPLTRGKLEGWAELLADRGLIPAHAGKT